MYEKAFPSENFLPSAFQKNFRKLQFTQVLPKDDHTESVQEEQLGFPNWTMILAICVVVDASRYLDILTFKKFGASSIFTWVQAGSASAACPEHPSSLEIMSMTFAAFICNADDPCSANTTKILNHFPQCHLGKQLYLCTFDIEAPTSNSWSDRDPSIAWNELFCPYFWLLRSPLLTSDLCYLPCQDFLHSPKYFPLLPLHQVFCRAWGIGKTYVLNSSGSL